MRSTLSTFIVAVVLLVACGPEYPDDEYHQDATDPNCIECHISRSPAYPDLDVADIPMPPDNHWEGDSVSSSYNECQSCHDMQ